MVISKEPVRNRYVGHRYVPLLTGEWDQTATYEGLSIVTFEGNSYTSKKRVPAGIAISNGEYWVVTGNYNAQIENYRQDVQEAKDQLEAYQKETDGNLPVPVERFGAIGNGTTSDSLAFQQAIAAATSVDNRHAVIQLQAGKTYLLKEADVALHEGVSIIGNGATLKMNGNVRFTLSDLEHFTCTDLHIETNVGLTADALTLDNHSIFFVTDPTKEMSFYVRNVSAISTISQVANVSRYGVLFDFPIAKPGSSFDFITVTNFRAALFIKGGRNFTVSHLSGVNCETLVWVETGRSLGLFDLSIVNTQREALTWVGKNNGIKENGKDTLLLGSDVDGVVMDNIRGEFSVERVVYSQASNVYATNLFAVNCENAKFCGPSPTNTKINVTARNIVTNIDDRLTTMGMAYHVLTLYYMKTVQIENVILNNFRTDKETATIGTYVITFSDGLTDATIKNVTAEINTNQPFIIMTKLIDASKTLKNIKMSNVELKQHGKFGGNVLFGCDTTDVIGWVNGFELENVKVNQAVAVVQSNTLLSLVGEFFTKKVTGITLKNVDSGYVTEGNPLTQKSSSFVSDHILSIDLIHRFLSITSGSNYRASYTNSQATGVDTIYVPKGKAVQKYVAYYLQNSYVDKMDTVYENNSNNAVRWYDAVKSIHFDMLVNTLAFWNLPINTASRACIVEVESSLGCGKAIFNGDTVTEIYKTGNCVFDSTPGMLQVKPYTGAGTDRSVYVLNNTGTSNRVKVTVTRL